MRIVEEVHAPHDPQRVFAFLNDFTTTTRWDPGTVSTVRLEGDGGPGTTYRNVSRFMGRTSTLVYETVASEPGRLVELRGGNDTVRVHDRMEISPHSVAGVPGSQVRYTADFTFQGPWRFAGWLAYPALRRLGRKGREGMTRALAHLS